MPRVLLIEDNAVTRRLALRSLQSESLEVLEAASGQVAIALAEKLRPDVVLIDMLLPDMSGFDVLERVRQILGEGTPCIAFTGLLSAVDERRLAAAGFDDLVNKPFEPARLRDTVRAHLSVRARSERFGARRRVLLVDDDELQRKMTAFRLSRLGFDVADVGSAEEALRLAPEQLPDAVVSDLLMPGIDGFELCTRLRADPRCAEVVIILVTNSYLEESDKALAKRVGADAYVNRSQNLQDLAEALRGALARPRAEREEGGEAQPEAQVERAARASRQLDRLVGVNASLAQRATMLSTELAILSGLTTALVEHRDTDAAIDAALSACLDAGGISWGLLLLHDTNARWTVRSVGFLRDGREGALPNAEELVSRLELAGHLNARFRAPLSSLLGAGATGEALVVPVRHQQRSLGVIILGASALLADHQVAFAEVLASHAALMLSLAHTFRDLESATLAEQARANLAESILHTIREPIIVFDRASNPCQWNLAAEPMVKRLRAIAPERWPEELGIHLRDQSRVLRPEEMPHMRALAGESADEEVYVRPLGEDPHWIAAAARPVRGGSTETHGAVLMLRDITEEKRSVAQQLTRDRMASIGLLAAGVAHEINNPLAAVLAELEMALEDFEPTHRGYDRLLAARDAAQRVRTITRDLKVFSRADSEEREPVNLHRTIEIAIRMAKPQARGRARIECELSPAPLVQGNQSRLVQVFLNLLVNAVQAIEVGDEEREWVRVRCREEADGALVEVADSGAGMSPAVRAKLFTPFFTTKPVGTGTGLGLSLSHRIVTDLGGRIDCESDVGKGTTFRLWFPATREPGLRESLLSAPTGSDSKPLVLLVEDDPLAQQMVSRALKEFCSVRVAQTTREALAKVELGMHFAVLLLSADAATTADSETTARLVAASRRAATLGLVPQEVLGPVASPLPSLPRPFGSVALQRFLRELLASLTQETP